MAISLVRDNPLTIQVGATSIISASNNLAFSDPNYNDAQLAYTVVSAPSDGTLRKNGSPTSTFTQADLNSNLSRAAPVVLY